MKNTLKLFCMTLCAVLMMGFAAYADTAITNIHIICGPDDEQPFVHNSKGTAPLFTSESDQYSMSYYDVNPDSTTYRSERTYELVFYSNYGYYFPDESQINVSYSGISSVQRKKTESRDTLVVRVRAYPYYKWATPQIQTAEKDLDKATSLKWTGDASRYEILMNWEDANGNERSRKTTSSSESLSLSSYNRGEGSDRSRVTGVAIRAMGSAGNNSRTAPSDWATIGTIDVYNFNFEEYETWSDIGSGSGSSGSTGTGTSGPSASTGVTVGWVQMGNDWYYRNVSGAWSTGWIWDGSFWYYADSTGRMQSGWLWDGTNWFYLNTLHDGTFGRMLTGWQQIDGYTFYLNPISDGTQGAMAYGWRNIDGLNYYFNEAHDGTFGRLLIGPV